MISSSVQHVTSRKPRAREREARRHAGDVGAASALLMGRNGGFITGSDVLISGVTATYFYGDVPEGFYGDIRGPDVEPGRPPGTADGR